MDLPEPSAPPAAEDLKLERFLPYRLVVAATLASRALARIYGHHFGIGIPEWRVMAMLGQFERLTARDVGELSHMHKTKVSRAVSELVTRGLVQKTPNRDDRREAFLSLSPPGRRIYDQVALLALAFEKRLTDDIPPHEMQTFTRVLSTLTERARVLSAGFSGVDD
ncbi:MAG: MarR family winged helix-turn-helix transcriptional regulator [Beijerinckiaceae bacterium]|jgi:DNA-binding MarR family transcriptional regulator|nr:MarR family winged helix-turn-helix transcriptional regulator [Beijerinckiaceae bacterium]